MPAKKLIGLLAAALLSTAPTGAYAQRPTEPDLAVTNSQIQAFEKVQLSLLDAIAIAEKRSPGSRAVDVSFDSQNDRTAYKVKTFQRNQVWEGEIDSKSGQLSGTGTVTHVSKLDAEDTAELAGLQNAGINLSEATAIAEKHGSGKAISAGLEEVNGRIVFEVVIIAEGKPKRITVDIKDGKVR